MRTKLLQRVQSFIAEHRMLRAGDRVGVAVSGGADSAALLLLLFELKERLGIRLCVLHLNHGLRGTQSDKDEKFVKDLSSTLGLEFHLSREDVAATARRQKRNLEEVARTLRYEFFNAAVEAGRVTRVAVAHSADDQAETVLAHLIRGTGPAGLGAIHPVVSVVVRPLLDVRRAELREYLRSRKQGWREDRSNRDTSRMRARIRHKLLPLLEHKFNPSVVGNLSRLARLAREDEVFWELLVEDCYQAIVEKSPTTLAIAIRDLLVPMQFSATLSASKPGSEAESANALALTKRLIRRIVAELKRIKSYTGDPKQLTANNVDQVLHLAKSSTSGHAIHLPGSIEVAREFDRLVFYSRPIHRLSNETCRRTPTPCRCTHYEYNVVLDGSGTATVRVAEIGSIFRLKVIDWPPLTSETRLLVAALDQALLRPPLLLRNWRPGDSYRPHGRKRARKLKRLLLEKRVGLRDRAGWPVLTSAGALVWARGLPVSAEFAPRHETRSSLVIAEEAL